MLIIQVNDYKNPAEHELSRTLSALDFPQPGFVKEGELIKFRGWVVIPDGFAEPQIVFEQGLTCVIEPLNVDRPDVAKKMHDVKGINVPLRSGFMYEFPLGCGEATISIQIGADRLKWKVVTVSQLDQEVCVTSLLTILDKLGSYDPSLLTKNELDLAKAAPEEFLDQLAESKFRKARSIRSENALNTSGFSQRESYYFSKLILELTDENIFFNFLDSAKNINSLVLHNPFGPGVAICSQSFLVNGTNILVFQADAEYFFVAQHFHAAEMVFFPRRNLILLLDGGYHAVSIFKSVIGYLIKKPEMLRQVNIKRSESQFLGLVVNDLTPYHFLYDVLPTFEHLKQQNLLDYAGPIYALNGKEYLSITSLYGLSSVESSVRPDGLEALQRDHGGFFLYVGASSKSNLDAQIQKLDERLIGFAAKHPAVKINEQGGPVIWIGISSFKRSWSNQVEALRNTLINLLGKYPSLFIIFDGMTSSIFNHENKDALTLADEEIVSEIVRSVLCPDQYLSVVGRTSLEKIQYAQLANIFIANYSTGSMYPARIHKKPGVAHLSKAMYPVVAHMHKHFDTRLISGSEVEDIPDPANPRVDFVSYKVNEAAIIREVSSLLTELGIAPKPDSRH